MSRFSILLVFVMAVNVYAMEVPAPSDESSEELVSQIEIREISQEKRESQLLISGSSLSLLRKKSEKSNGDILLLSSDTSASEAEVPIKKRVSFDSNSRSLSASCDSSLSHSYSSISSPRLSSSTEHIKSAEHKSSKKLLRISSKSRFKKPVNQEYKPQRLIEIFKKNGTEEIFEALHPNPNMSDEDGRTLLIISIQNGNVVVTEDLLRYDKIDVNQTDKWGNTPLHHATLKPNSSIIKLLLFDYRVEVLIRNKEKFYPNQYITDESSPEIFALKYLFFVRGQYEGAVNEEIRTLKKQLNGNTQGLFDSLVAAVKKRVENDAKKQDQPLPDTVQLPINDEFIRRLIVCRAVRSGIIQAPSHKIKK